MGHQRLIRDTFLTLIALVIFGSTNFVFNVVVGRVYGSAYLGMVSTALSTALLLSYVVSTSFPGAVAKYVSEYLGRKKKEDADYVLKLALKYGIIIGIILTAFALIFSNYLCDIFNMQRDIFLLSTSLIILYILYRILKMAYYGYRNVKRYFYNEIIADSLFLAALGVVVIFKWGYYIYFPYIILYIFFIFSALHFFWPTLKVKKPPMKKEIEKKFFAYAGVSFIGTFSSMSLKSLSIMLSSMYVPSREIGYLSAAFALSSIFFLFPNAIGRILTPEFSFNFGVGNKQKIISLMNKSTEYLSVFVNIVNSLGIIFAWVIVYIFYGSDFSSTVILLQLALVLYWPSMVGRSVISILSGTKYVHIPNFISLMGLFNSLILWIFLIPIFGIIGTMMGYIIESWIDMILTFYFGYKYFNFQYKIILKHAPWILLISFVSIIPHFPLYFKTFVSSILLLIYVWIYKSEIIYLIHQILKLNKRDIVITPFNK